MIEIDGSYGSAGGQILRTSLSLSALTKNPCRVFNIRAGRPRPGLMTQHLLGAQALARLCSAKLEGDFLGSKELKFYPAESRECPDSLNINIDTAGSITLALQTLILPALLSQKPKKITFNGGASDTFFSPTIDYFRYVFSNILEKFGAKLEIKIIKRGYYPEGKARVEVKIFPSGLKVFSLIERGNFEKILMISGASEFLKNKKVAERQIAGAKEILGKLRLATQEQAEYYQTDCPGSQICLIAEFENTIIGTDNLGKLGKRAEDTGKEAALQLLKEQKSGACLDKHLADQILPFLALSKKRVSVSISEITDHCRTNIWVIEKFLEGKFEIEGNLITWNPV